MDAVYKPTWMTIFYGIKLNSIAGQRVSLMDETNKFTASLIAEMAEHINQALI